MSAVRAPRVEPARAYRGMRLAARVVVGLGAVALAALAWAWRADRARAYATPRWDPSQFVTLRGGATNGEETWVVAFHPGCGHCEESLERVESLCSAVSPRPRIVALLIDVPRATAKRAAPRVAADAVLWDARSVWRSAWGHRIYGEVLRFAAGGRLLGTLARDDSSGIARSLPRPSAGRDDPEL